MKNLTYESIVETLLTKVPEISSALDDKNLDLPHFVFGTLGIFLAQNLHENENKGDLIRKLIEFLEEMASSEDPKIKDLLNTSVLEPVIDDPLAENRLKSFSSKALTKQIEIVKKFWEQSG